MYTSSNYVAKLIDKRIYYLVKLESLLDTKKQKGNSALKIVAKYRKFIFNLS